MYMTTSLDLLLRQIFIDPTALAGLLSSNTNLPFTHLVMRALTSHVQSVVKVNFRFVQVCPPWKASIMVFPLRPMPSAAFLVDMVRGFPGPNNSGLRTYCRYAFGISSSSHVFCSSWTCCSFEAVLFRTIATRCAVRFRTASRRNSRLSKILMSRRRLRRCLLRPFCAISFFFSFFPSLRRLRFPPFSADPGRAWTMLSGILSNS
mmetsp:Transcript_30887/g.89950  ORF Transcript_30887/g.89950 Transcript_30887/m.89950 type:complete len:205 (+) Transcript_30887:274-888(+)